MKTRIIWTLILEFCDYRTTCALRRTCKLVAGLINLEKLQEIWYKHIIPANPNYCREKRESSAPHSFPAAQSRPYSFKAVVKRLWYEYRYKGVTGTLTAMIQPLEGDILWLLQRFHDSPPKPMLQVRKRGGETNTKTISCQPPSNNSFMFSYKVKDHGQWDVTVGKYHSGACYGQTETHIVMWNRTDRQINSLQTDSTYNFRFVCRGVVCDYSKLAWETRLDLEVSEIGDKIY